MQSDVNARVSTGPSRVEGVNATSGGLVKATLGAAVVAGAILTFVWLPAEYGIDPTGIGHVLGLTEMGHIKEQLQAEADVDVGVAQVTSTVTTDLNLANVSLTLEAMQDQLSAIATAVGVDSKSNGKTALVQPAEQPIPVPETDVVASSWRDEVDYTLAPDEGIEVKLVMEQGDIAEYEWSANGAVVNHDTHGDGNGEDISYEQGRAVPEQAGQLIAAFAGNHGWFWRNRTDDSVVVTLRTRGTYKEMKLP